MSKSPDAFRTISEVADWLGVQAHVLRFWESKFSQVKPVKRAGGRRYYRPADMLLLGGIRKLLHDDGLTIKGVQKILREQGMAYVSDLSLPLDDDVMEALEAATPERPAAPFSDPPPPEPEPMVGEVVEFPTTPEPVAAPAADIPEPPAAAPPPMPPDAAVEVQEDETPDAEPEEIAEPPAADAPVADAPAADADEQPSDTAPEPLTAAPPPVTPDEIAQTQDPSQEPEGIEEAVEDTVEPGQSFDSVAEIRSDDTPAHDTPAHDPQPAPEESAPETDVAPAPLDHAAVAQDDAPRRRIRRAKRECNRRSARPKLRRHSDRQRPRNGRGGRDARRSHTCDRIRTGQTGRKRRAGLSQHVENGIRPRCRTI